MTRFLFLFLLLPLASFAPGEKQPDYVVAVTEERMVTDNLGNVYLIKDESITKRDVKGVVQRTFSDKTFGPITSADATNALRIVLFYKDFNRVVFLDNTMSQNGESVKLEALGYPMATLAASSHDNGMWVYDQQNFELIRLNRALEPEQRTGNISQLTGIDIQPNFLIEKDNRLFLNDPATGILVFDVFGTFSKTVPVKELKTFQVIDDNIVYYRGGMMKQWNLLTAEEAFFEEPVDTAALDMRLEKNAVFVLEKEKLMIYNRQ